MSDAQEWPEDTVPPGLPEGRLSGRYAFEETLRLALSVAGPLQLSPLVLCDDDFADWPLGERSVIDSLNAWATQGRHLRILALDYTRLRELHPRFVQWRTTWGHLVEARACRHAAPGELPSALWTPGWTFERLDRTHGTAVATTLAERRVALQERIERWWAQASPAFPASTLGL